MCFFCFYVGAKSRMSDKRQLQNITSSSLRFSTVWNRYDYKQRSAIIHFSFSLPAIPVHQVPFPVPFLLLLDLISIFIDFPNQISVQSWRWAADNKTDIRDRWSSQCSVCSLVRVLAISDWSHGTHPWRHGRAATGQHVVKGALDMRYITTLDRLSSSQAIQQQI